MAGRPRRDTAAVIGIGGANGIPDGSVSSDGNLSGGGDPSAPIVAGEPIIIDPTTLDTGSGGDNGDTPGEPKRRGRKPGSRNSTSKNRASASPVVNVAGLERLLFGVHQGMAKLFATPELALDGLEAKLFAESYAAMAAHYPSLEMSAKVTDTITFVGVVGMTYGARVMAIREKRKSARMAPVPSAVPSPMPNPAPPSNGAAPPPAPRSSMVEIPGVGMVNLGPRSNGGLN